MFDDFGENSCNQSSLTFKQNGNEVSHTPTYSERQTILYNDHNQEGETFMLPAKLLKASLYDMYCDNIFIAKFQVGPKFYIQTSRRYSIQESFSLLAFVQEETIELQRSTQGA